MAEHTPTPWRVFKTTDGRKLVGVGAQDGQGILDSGYGVWSWDDAEGIANAEMVVKAVNNHDKLVQALEFIRDGYDNQDVNHVDFRVKAYQVACDVLTDLIAPRHT